MKEHLRASWDLSMIAIIDRIFTLIRYSAGEYSFLSHGIT
jgi:hypothetical protein